VTKLAWATDIHLDHVDPQKAWDFIERVRASGAAGLLLGGDTSTAVDIAEMLVEMAESVAIPVYFVLGNHDYYRGSIASVRERVAALDHPRLCWLTAAGPQEPAPGVVLIGVGGWGDARLGDFAGSDVVLTDYVAISELENVFDRYSFTGVFGQDTALETELRRLGREAAEVLAPQLVAAAETSRQVLVLTHVPPFREACWHEGRISADTWLPGFSCGAVGEVLLAAANRHPECRFTVLCGHTHGGGLAQLTDNLVVHTQAAAYGSPDFVLVEAQQAGITVLA